MDIVFVQDIVLSYSAALEKKRIKDIKLMEPLPDSPGI